jgi:flagellar operon protein
MAGLDVPLLGAGVPGGPGPGAAAGPSGADRAGELQGGAPAPFAEVLGAKLDPELRFSAHAQARLRSREIPLTDEDRSRLAQATSAAARKGAREALLLMGDIGFIVSVGNRTVITALDSSRLDGGIVTGIDAAVMVPEAGR